MTNPGNRKLRVAVVSPFLDKNHGTERIVIEWFSRLADDFELHVYSQRVEDFDPSKFTYHRIAEIPGPHILNFLWWFAANHVRRAWDAYFYGRRCDLVFSAGINCFDADVISVHIVFAEFFRQAKAELRFSSNPMRLWPRLLHRRAYYALIIFLERLIYPTNQRLVLYAKKTALDLKRFYPRKSDSPVLYLGLDHARFNASRSAELRSSARTSLGLNEGDFVLLLIGNDLLKKGVLVLFEAMSQLSELPLRLLIVGRESAAGYQSILEGKGLSDRVLFLGPRRDVEFYFAAADVYVGPSLEDTFALPPQEAMSCGLPVIASLANGVSEIITHGENGLILEDSRDASGLAAMIRQLYMDPGLRALLGRNAAKSVERFTWERNAQDLKAILREVVRENKLGDPG